MKALLSTGLFALCGLLSCQKDQQEKTKKILLSKRITETAVVNYSYDLEGRLVGAESDASPDSYTVTCNSYDAKDQLIDYTIEYENELETDSRFKNEFDEQGRLTRTDRYELASNKLISYALIEYFEDSVTRKTYNAPASLYSTSIMHLTGDKRNLAKHISYSGNYDGRVGVIAYHSYDGKKNPNNLLPKGYSPFNINLSENNPVNSTWIAATAPAGTSVNFSYSYQYNAEEYPVVTTSVGDYSNSTIHFEYIVR